MWISHHVLLSALCSSSLPIIPYFISHLSAGALDMLQITQF